MALIDTAVPDETVADKANEIREKIAQVVNLTDIRLLEIRNLVRIYGRVQIAAELGDDAQSLLTVYTRLKEAVEAAKDTTVEELP